MKVIEELQRSSLGEPIRRVLHKALPRSQRASVDFMPIACSKDEGIVFPGHHFEGEPTCLDCIRVTGDDH